MSSLEKGGEPLAVEGLTYLLTIESLAKEALFVKPTTMLRMGLLASLKPICHWHIDTPALVKGGHKFYLLYKFDNPRKQNSPLNGNS